MSSTSKTANIALNQWVLTDPFLMEDMNSDNLKIDAAIKSLSLENIGHIETAASSQIISLSLAHINWSKYFKVIIYYSLLHDATPETSVFSFVRGNNKSGSSNYALRTVSTGNSSIESNGYFFRNVETRYSDPSATICQQRRRKIEIYTDAGCTLFQTNCNIDDNSSVDYGGILKASSSSYTPLPLNLLSTLNFSCSYALSSNTDTIHLLPGTKFDIYGVKQQ